MIYSDGGQLLRIVALLDQLEEDLVFQLLTGGLTQGYHVFNQSEDIVELGLLANADQHLEHLQSSFLVLLIHQGESFGQRSVLCDQHLGVIFAHAEERGTLSEHFFEECLSVEVDDVVLVLLRGVLDLEDTVLTVW